MQPRLIPAARKARRSPAAGLPHTWRRRVPYIPPSRRGSCTGCGKVVQLSATSAREPYCKTCRAAGVAPSRAMHGGAKRYKRGCRCEPCREGQARRMREYAARRRAEGRPIRRPGDPRECAHCGEAFRARRDQPGTLCGARCAKLAQGWAGVPVRRFRPSPTLRASIYERDGWVCQLCGSPVDPEAPAQSRESATLDHITPRAHGGSDDPSNLRLAHMGCNADRGAPREEVA